MRPGPPAYLLPSIQPARHSLRRLKKCPPLPAQVRRLIAVLSVRGVSKAALLEAPAWGHKQAGEAAGAGGGGGGVEAALAGLREEDVRLLEACGLSREAGLRSLVNFTGGWVGGWCWKERSYRVLFHVGSNSWVVAGGGCSPCSV